MPSTRNDLLKLLNSIDIVKSRREVFFDFVAMGAFAFHNGVLLNDAFEAEYLERVKRYHPRDHGKFPEALGLLTIALEEDIADVLGWVFGQLELGNKSTGQFFTPDAVSRVSAGIVLTGPSPLDLPGGFATVYEPAIGSGGMVIAVAHTLHERGINFQRCLHVTGQDIDRNVLLMAYLQLSLLYIPAVLRLGNSLSNEPPREVWRTPAHILGQWDYRLANRPEPASKAKVERRMLTPEARAEITP